MTTISRSVRKLREEYAQAYPSLRMASNLESGPASNMPQGMELADVLPVRRRDREQEEVPVDVGVHEAEPSKWRCCSMAHD